MCNVKWLVKSRKKDACTYIFFAISIFFLLSGKLNQPQNIQYGNVDDTPLGKYLTKTTLLLLLPLASMYCVCIVTSCEHYV